MQIKDFYFDLPEHLIAQVPAENRQDSRLMVMNRAANTIKHLSFSNLPALLPENAILVVNNSKVRKARIYARSETGGKVEFLFLREVRNQVWECMVSKVKKQKRGKRFTFAPGCHGTIVGDAGTNKLLEAEFPVDESFFQNYGHVPLPPYIKREDRVEDEKRYQTVFSKQPGSVAAPTAGLHFTQDIIAQIESRNISMVSVTLHVGLGTFLPIRTEHIEDHSMHEEYYSVDKETARTVTQGKQDGRPVVAVGTTSVRTLESAWNEGELKAGTGSTDLFITPGYQFSVVDQVVTNFHTPESSLIVLVSAFAGKDAIRNAYKAAVKEKYRFFSYGDAMYIQ